MAAVNDAPFAMQSFAQDTHLSLQIRGSQSVRNQLTTTFEGDHVLVLSDGEKNFEFSTRIWTEVVEVCEANNCFRVLGVSTTTKPLEALEGYDHARLFRDLGIDRRYKIAWVENNADAQDIINFIETVLYNRGLPGKAFEDVDEARAWLLGDEVM